jgi:hypothetical protein
VQSLIHPRRERRFVLAAVAALATLPLVLRADERITYTEHVRPIFVNNCLSCHNADRQRAGVDLSSFPGVVAGGSGGPVVAPEDPDGSALFAVVSHARQPHMPPNQPRLDDATLATLRQWIAQGVYNTRDSKAPAPTQSAGLDLALGNVPQRPDDVSTLLPRGLPLAEIVQAERAGAVPAIAGQTWAPLVALAGQQQVLLYQPRTAELLGVLPFAPGFPHDLHFSRSGQVLVAGGGIGGQRGSVTLYRVRDGRSLGQRGEAYDAVLASHLDATQQRLALGGPDRVVKVYATADGTLRHRIEKHTEWITAVAFSPDAVLLATADRNGGLEVWEAAAGASFHSLEGHAAAITDLAWRLDGDVLASAGEDGRIRLWEMHHGRELKDINGHSGGTLAIDFSPDGTLVSGGRDHAVKLWQQDGKPLKTLGELDALVTSVAFCDGGQLVVAGDWNGTVKVWNVADGKEVATLDANPPSFEVALAAAQQAAEAARAEHDKIQQQAAEQAEALASAQEKLASHSDRLAAAQEALTATQSEHATAQQTQAKAAAAAEEATKAFEQAQTKATTLATETAGATDALAAAAAADAAAQRAVTTAEAAELDAEQAADLEGLRSTAKETAAALQAAHGQVAELKAALTAARNERDAAEEKQAAHQDQLTAAQDTLQAAIAKRQQAENTLAKREQAQAETAAAVEALERSHAKSQSALATARAKRAAAEQQRAKWQAGSVRARLDQLQAELPALRSTAAEAAIAAQTAINAADAAQARLVRANKELAGGDAAREQRAADIAAATRTLDTAAQTHTQRQEQLTRFQALVAAHTTNAAALEAFATEQAELPPVVATATAATQDVDAKLSAALTALEEAVTDAEFAVEDAQFELEAAEYAAGQTTDRLAALPEEIAQLEKEAAAADQAAADQKKAATRTREALEAAEARLAKQQSKYKQLIAAWLDRE